MNTEKINISFFKTPLGELIIGSFSGYICLCDWRYRAQRERIDNRVKKGLSANFIAYEDDLIKETKKQLNEYFLGERLVFNLPLKLIGSEFQQGVWNKLLQIEYGSTWSYLKLSQSLKKADAIRAVGAANGGNALSILIPCHRVIATNGGLTGYAGGLEAKKKLLQLENPMCFGQLELPFQLHE